MLNPRNKVELSDHYDRRSDHSSTPSAMAKILIILLDPRRSLHTNLPKLTL